MLGLSEPLHTVAAFSHFPEKYLDRLGECGKPRALLPDSRLFEAGEQSREISVVTQGRLRVERTTPYGPLILSRYGGGDLVGDREFVDGHARPGAAIADSEVMAVTFDPDQLAWQAKTDQGFDLAFAWALWRSLSVQLRRANDRLTAFFDDGGSAPNPNGAAGRSPRRQQIRVDMVAKRNLFQEQRLSSMEINFLASLSREERFEPGQVIFREGETGEKMYVILDGQVMISKYIPGAGEEALSFLDRGDYFGEMALIDRQPRSAEAKAHGDGATVLAIPRDVVEGILDIEKVSSVRLLKLLCSLVAQRLRESDEKLIGWHLLAGGAPS